MGNNDLIAPAALGLLLESLIRICYHSPDHQDDILFNSSHIIATHICPKSGRTSDQFWAVKFEPRVDNCV